IRDGHVTGVQTCALPISPLALPFYPAGVIVAAVLTRSRMPIGRVYAVDLFGAALGAPAVALCLRCVGGETSVLVVGVVAAGASQIGRASWRERWRIAVAR